MLGMRHSSCRRLCQRTAKPHQCPPLALSGHPGCTDPCPLSGVKRMMRTGHNFRYDPKRTSQALTDILFRRYRRAVTSAFSVIANSIAIFAEQQFERRLSGAASLRHGIEADDRLLDRTAATSAVNLPFPLSRRLGPVFDNNGKVQVINHRVIPGCSH